ncbi:hypothetical protein Spock_156 [Bacillus phage Spock]|uniref:Recombination, repair and ssDNA binding protein n=2 Tax=Bequatrovirus spock TaxID=1918008 RepID=A0A1X9SG90_9CAUD|nr:hypothetical protein Spock_156 [Bacillus phage Spock]AGY48556.1 hypothetical protein Spock_156 [Bacillus phage Spock]ARQ95069.1 recombination, repair and ssDNA binding protein [Bacillus phage Flapjack]
MIDVNVDTLDFQNLRIKDESGQELIYDMRNELKINESILQQEMLEQPSKYIYWSSLLEKLRYYQEMEELNLEVVWSKLDGEARTHITAQGGKATKDQVEAYIKQQEAYLKQKKVCVHYTHVIGRLQRIVKAFEQRKDMLQSYGKQVANDLSYGHGAGSKFMQDEQAYLNYAQQQVNPQIGRGY